MASSTALKVRMQTRLAKLAARIESVGRESRTVPSADLENQATETEGDEVLGALEAAAVSEMEQIRTTLGKIDDGSYGICVTCGSEIGEKRLAALPSAVQCIDCARRAAA